MSKSRRRSARTGSDKEFCLALAPSQETRYTTAGLDVAWAASSDGNPNYSGRPISAHNALVDRMLELIHMRYAEVLTLRVLGTSIGRQPAYLGGLFHREVGVTVREYVTRLRLERASELVHDGVKIEAVALLVGYRSKKNFYWRFRQSFGTTPGEHRCQGGAPATSSVRMLHRGSETESRSMAADALNLRSFRDEWSTPATDSVAATGISARPLCEASLRVCHQALAHAVRIQRVLLREFRDSRFAIMLTDEKCRYIGANRSAISLTGYSRPELRDLTPRDIFRNTPQPETQCVWQIILTTPRQRINALLHPKTRESLSVHLVTLKNLVWDGPEMSALLEGMPP